MKKQKQELPTLEEFKETCNSHDWYYSYSDDHKVWKAGHYTAQYMDAVVTKGGLDYLKVWKDAANKASV